MFQRALFEVRVPGVSPREEVRISGSIHALGEWAVHRSVPMTRRDGPPDTWYLELEVPVDLTVQYRYLVVQRFKLAESKDAFGVVRWETTLHPRHFYLAGTAIGEDLPGSPLTVSDGPQIAPEVMTPFVRRDGTFGENEVGEKAQDDRWLVGMSELHLQLHSSENHPIHLDTQSSDQRYSVRVQAIKYCVETENVCEDCQCSPIRVKVLDREQGDCQFQEQGEHGWPYHPHQMLVYHTRAPSFTYCAFVVDLYNSDKLCVGRASILPQQLQDSYGTLVLTVFSSHLLPVGTITFTYLIAHAVQQAPRIHRTRHSFANYWKQHKRSLDIGHRGLGNSHKIGDKLKPTATENTIASLKQAGAHGADYVEFDVQLTKDLVPVVYHDFTVCTTLARRGFSSGELYLVHVKDLTLSQLQNLQLDHSSVLEERRKSVDVSSTEKSPFQSFIVAFPLDSAIPAYRHRRLSAPCDQLGSCPLSSSLSSSEAESSYYSSEEDFETYRGQRRGSYSEEPPERKTFPTLVQVFKDLPPHIGFNIEVKYPVPEIADPQYNFSYFERNQMADIILKVVYRYAHKRKIIFSCFDPDMCTILRLKQPKYPVIFLSNTMHDVVPVDMRGRTLNDATMFAKAEKLLGVNVNSSLLLANPDLIASVRAKKLVLFTWGEKNNTLDSIVLQKKNGVAAVIYDRINFMIPYPKNVFQDEQEEEEESLCEISSTKLS